MKTIIARAPTRLSLGGGTTDLTSYSSKFGGFVISAAINKYCFVSCHETYDSPIRLGYSKTEVVDSVDEVKHNVSREVLKLMKIKDHFEITTWTDAPNGTGLGGSSAFTVALLLALHTYLGKTISKKELAEMACDIEINKCGYSVGKQDQFCASYGGIHSYTFCKNGDVLVDSLNGMDFKKFRDGLVMFYTGISREGWEIQKNNIERIEFGDIDLIKSLHKVKDIGYEIKRCLESNDFYGFGSMLDSHWSHRKRMGVSNVQIDDIYNVAKKTGVTGGKLLGAGGGGFFLFHCPSLEIKQSLEKNLHMNGAINASFDWDWDGARVVLQ